MNVIKGLISFNQKHAKRADSVFIYIDKNDTRSNERHVNLNRVEFLNRKLVEAPCQRFILKQTLTINF